MSTSGTLDRARDHVDVALSQLRRAYLIACENDAGSEDRIKARIRRAREALEQAELVLDWSEADARVSVGTKTVAETAAEYEYWERVARERIEEGRR
jgi:hypothetical protein